MTGGMLRASVPTSPPSFDLALVVGALAGRIFETAPTEIAALASYLKCPFHMVFQVSSSSAAGAGDYGGEGNRPFRSAGNSAWATSFPWIATTVRSIVGVLRS